MMWITIIVVALIAGLTVLLIVSSKRFGHDDGSVTYGYECSVKNCGFLVVSSSNDKVEIRKQAHEMYHISGNYETDKLKRASAINEEKWTVKPDRSGSYLDSGVGSEYSGEGDIRYRNS